MVAFFRPLSPSWTHSVVNPSARKYSPTNWQSSTSSSITRIRSIPFIILHHLRSSRSKELSNMPSKRFCQPLRLQIFTPADRLFTTFSGQLVFLSVYATLRATGQNRSHHEIVSLSLADRRLGRPDGNGRRQLADR